MIRRALHLYESTNGAVPEGTDAAVPATPEASPSSAVPKANGYMRPMGATPYIDLETLRSYDEGATDGTSRLAEKAERVEPTDPEWDMGEPVVCDECGHYDPAHAMWCHSVGFDDGEARDTQGDVS